jgi:hypothetical protein
MMIKRGLRILLLCLGFWVVNTAQAQALFYEGPVVIDTISAEVELFNQAEVTIHYVLVNRGEEPETVELQYAGATIPLMEAEQELNNPVSFEPGEVREIQVQYEDVIDGTLLQSYSIDPTLTFNSLHNLARVNEFSARVALPPDIDRLLGSNQDYLEEEQLEGGRVAYIWQLFDLYPTPLSLRWTVIDANLRLEKTASIQTINEPNTEVEITILVENQGQETLEDLTLHDDYLPSDYEAVGEGDGLSLETYQESDARLVWEVSIARLGPGEILTYSYRLRYMGDASTPIHFNLKPCSALSEGVLVAISNAVPMRVVGSTEPPTVSSLSGPINWPLVLLALIAGFGLAMLVMGAILALRKR